MKIEYNLAPSGYATLYNYKTPFMPSVSGVGFQGVVLFDSETNKVQCSICGEWFDFLGIHVKTHKLTVKQYKYQFGLNQETALMS